MSNTISNLFVRVGESLYQVISSQDSLYGIYLIAFFVGIYALISFLLRNLKMFKEKGAKRAANVVAGMISIITVGSIFYGTGPQARSQADLILLFNGFGGFIFVLFFAIGFAGAGFYLFKKYKESNLNLSLFFLSICLYVASSLLLPFFNKVVNGVYQIGSYGGYIGSRAQGLGFFGDILIYTQIITSAIIIVCLFILILNMFRENESETVHNTRERQKPDQYEKDKADSKELVKAIGNELRNLNNHFNNKINLLNMLRADIGNIKDNNYQNQQNGRRE